VSDQLLPKAEYTRTIKNAVVSVHDVMPETMGNVSEIMGTLRQLRIAPATLLVVPGRAWDEANLAQLRRWHSEGHELAGHGWSHTCPKPTNIYHRLHSRFISRNVAEHLALDESEILQLINRCHAWFIEQGLPAPLLYVPPAWAMGKMRMRRLGLSPFRYFEYLNGVYDADADFFAHTPLSGYEADTAIRANVLSVLNALNLRLCGLSGRPLRLSIHPHDFGLKLSCALHAHLASVKCALVNEDLFTPHIREKQPKTALLSPNEGVPHEN